jgi:DNA-binding LacI/PurR family transcriptional regulator
LERDFTSYGIDSVFFDGFYNARIAVQHLTDCGCKNICHISGPNGTQNAEERINGYLMALSENGIRFQSSMIASGDYSHRGGYLAMKQLLDNNSLIDGVFCANDQMGVGALMVLKEYGLVVPDKIKVIGYDDIFVSSIIEPSLSTIHIAKHQAGNIAARIVIDRINSNDLNIPPQRILLEGRLVVRKSTVASAANDWILTDW